MKIWLPLILIIGIGLWLLYESDSNARLERVESAESHEITQAKEIISRYMDKVRQDVRILSRHSDLQQYVNKTSMAALARLGDQFIEFARYRGIYDQIRYIDLKGNEILRMDWNNGKPSLRAKSKLQNKANRYYVKKTAELKREQVYVSLFDLNIENGKIEQPIKPVIRLGTPVFDQLGRKQGMIIVNYLGEALLNRLKKIGHEASGEQLWLVNETGDWLLGPSRDLEWGFMYGREKYGLFAKKYPTQWNQSKSASHLQDIYDGALFSTQWFRLDELIANNDTQIPNGTVSSEKWLLVAYIPPEVLASRLAGRSGFVLMVFFLMTLLPVVLVGVMSYRAVHSHVEPLIKDSEIRFKSIFDSAPDAIVIADSQGRIILANKRLEEMFGYEHGELMGEEVEKLIPPESQEKHRKLRHDHIVTGNTSELVMSNEISGIRKDGVRIPLEANLNIINTSKGLLSTVVIRDITARKESEEKIHMLNTKLTRRSVELEAINHELEAFCYSVSHDLRTPLRAIDGFSKTLATNYADQLDDVAQDRLDRIRAAAQRMAGLIDDLLNLSRISRLQVQRQETDLSNIASAVAEELMDGDPERRVNIQIQPELTCQADQKLIRVALDNLMGNAWKFTSKKDMAEIEVGKQQMNGNGTVFFVKDNGAGFDMRYAKKLFGAFQRLHDAQEFPGTGVGLATVQRVINKHGGRIWAESEEGKGTTFFFTMDKGGERL